MRNSNHYRFRLDTVWDKDKEITAIIQAAKAYYQRSFSEKCVTILYAVFKPLAVALKTNSVIEVRKAIETSRDKVETFYDLALILVSSEVLTSDSAKSPPQDLSAQTHKKSTSAKPKATQPSSKSNDPPKEKPASVNSGSPAKSLYAGLKDDD